MGSKMPRESAEEPCAEGRQAGEESRGGPVRWFMFPVLRRPEGEGQPSSVPSATERENGRLRRGSLGKKGPGGVGD